MLNSVALNGNLVRDPEYRTTSNGTTYTTFIIANDCGHKGLRGEAQLTLFIECVIYGRPADIIAKHFRKGSAISVTGRLVPNTYTAKDGTKKSNLRINCDRFDFLSQSASMKIDKPLDEPTGEEAMTVAELDPTTADDLPF